jgi:hypothetical protein
MENIAYTIKQSVKPLNNIQEGLGDLVIKTLIEKFNKNWVNIKYKNDGFSNQTYRLSTLIFYGTPMTNEYKIIFDKLLGK